MNEVIAEIHDLIIVSRLMRVVNEVDDIGDWATKHLGKDDPHTIKLRTAVNELNEVIDYIGE